MRQPARIRNVISPLSERMRRSQDDLSVAGLDEGVGRLIWGLGACNRRQRRVLSRQQKLNDSIHRSRWVGERRFQVAVAGRNYKADGGPWKSSLASSAVLGVQWTGRQNFGGAIARRANTASGPLRTLNATGAYWLSLCRMTMRCGAATATRVRLGSEWPLSCITLSPPGR